MSEELKDHPQLVRIVDLDVKFLTLTWFMTKFIIAILPALFLAGVIMYFVGVLVMLLAPSVSRILSAYIDEIAELIRIINK